MGVDLVVIIGYGLVIPLRILLQVIKRRKTFLDKKDGILDLTSIKEIPEIKITDSIISTTEKTYDIEDIDDLKTYIKELGMVLYCHDYGSLIKLISRGDSKLLEKYDSDKSPETSSDGLDYLSHQVFIGLKKETLFNCKVGGTPFYFLNCGLYITNNPRLRTGGCAAMAIKIDEYSADSESLEIVRSKLEKLFINIFGKSETEYLFGKISDTYHDDEDSRANFGKWLYSYYC